MKDIKTIGIIGLGALGTMYATLLTQSLGKERVLVLADRERTDATAGTACGTTASGAI